MERSLFLKLKTALSEVAEEKRKNTFKNEDTIFSKSGFKMNTKSGLSYLDNLYKLENIFKNNGNKEALQDVEKEIQSIDTQLRNKQFVDLETPNKIALPAKHPNKNRLNSPTKLVTKKSLALESFNEEYFMSSYSREDLYKNLNKEDLNEDIEKHDTLNPLLFDEDDELKPDIKEAIEKIVNQFVEDLKIDGVKIEVKDIILVGSNVSYNYTKDSDLDIHIIVDKDTLDCDPEIYTLLYGAYRSLFNKNYDITIKEIPVEVYVELV